MARLRASLRTLALLAAACFVGAVAAVSLVSPVSADHMPADKMMAKGATIEVTGPGVTHTILTGTMRTSNPSDLILSVTLECSILTNVTTTGHDDAQACGRVEVWVEVDQVAVPVDGGDSGHVVFCDRAHQQHTSGFDGLDDNKETITSYLKTRTANAFNWATLDVGSGIHTIEAKPLLTETHVNKGVAQAAIGARTLVVEPSKMANDAVI